VHVVVIGLTGSIGMGKSTVAGMFRDLGVPVFDADAEVHRLYAGGGAFLAALAERFPDAVSDGAVDRAALAAAVTGDPAALADLEAIVHPLVREAQERFLVEAESAGNACAVLEIPLLFEVGAETRVDVVVVVSAPAAIQRQRVLARPGMTGDRLNALEARQVRDSEKRRRADHVIDTGASLEQTRESVAGVLAAISAGGRCGGEAGHA
jgi:dephospho-CoA kinase